MAEASSDVVQPRRVDGTTVRALRIDEFVSGAESALNALRMTPQNTPWEFSLVLVLCVLGSVSAAQAGGRVGGTGCVPPVVSDLASAEALLCFTECVGVLASAEAVLDLGGDMGGSCDRLSRLSSAALWFRALAFAAMHGAGCAGAPGAEHLPVPTSLCPAGCDPVSSPPPGDAHGAAAGGAAGGGLLGHDPTSDSGGGSVGGGAPAQRRRQGSPPPLPRAPAAIAVRAAWASSPLQVKVALAALCAPRPDAGDIHGVFSTVDARAGGTGAKPAPAVEYYARAVFGADAGCREDLFAAFVRVASASAPGVSDAHAADHLRTRAYTSLRGALAPAPPLADHALYMETSSSVQAGQRADLLWRELLRARATWLRAVDQALRADAECRRAAGHAVHDDADGADCDRRVAAARALRASVSDVGDDGRAGLTAFLDACEGRALCEGWLARPLLHAISVLERRTVWAVVIPLTPALVHVGVGARLHPFLDATFAEALVADAAVAMPPVTLVVTLVGAHAVAGAAARVSGEAVSAVSGALSAGCPRPPGVPQDPSPALRAPPPRQAPPNTPASSLSLCDMLVHNLAVQHALRRAFGDAAATAHSVRIPPHAVQALRDYVFVHARLGGSGDASMPLHAADHALIRTALAYHSADAAGVAAEQRRWGVGDHGAEAGTPTAVLDCPPFADVVTTLQAFMEAVFDVEHSSPVLTAWHVFARPSPADAHAGATSDGQTAAGEATTYGWHVDSDMVHDPHVWTAVLVVHVPSHLTGGNPYPLELLDAGPDGHPVAAPLHGGDVEGGDVAGTVHIFPSMLYHRSAQAPRGGTAPAHSDMSGKKPRRAHTLDGDVIKAVFLFGSPELAAALRAAGRHRSPMVLAAPAASPAALVSAPAPLTPHRFVLTLESGLRHLYSRKLRAGAPGDAQGAFPAFNMGSPQHQQYVADCVQHALGDAPTADPEELLRGVTQCVHVPPERAQRQWAHSALLLALPGADNGDASLTAAARSPPAGPHGQRDTSHGTGPVRAGPGTPTPRGVDGRAPGADAGPRPPGAISSSPPVCPWPAPPPAARAPLLCTQADASAACTSPCVVVAVHGAPASTGCDGGGGGGGGPHANARVLREGSPGSADVPDGGEATGAHGAGGTAAAVAHCTAAPTQSVLGNAVRLGEERVDGAGPSALAGVLASNVQARAVGGPGTDNADMPLPRPPHGTLHLAPHELRLAFRPGQAAHVGGHFHAATATDEQRQAAKAVGTVVQDLGRSRSAHTRAAASGNAPLFVLSADWQTLLLSEDGAGAVSGVISQPDAGSAALARIDEWEATDPLMLCEDESARFCPSGDRDDVSDDAREGSAHAGAAGASTAHDPLAALVTCPPSGACAQPTPATRTAVPGASAAAGAQGQPLPQHHGGDAEYHPLPKQSRAGQHHALAPVEGWKVLGSRPPRPHTEVVRDSSLASDTLVRPGTRFERLADAITLAAECAVHRRIMPPSAQLDHSKLRVTCTTPNCAFRVQVGPAPDHAVWGRPAWYVEASSAHSPDCYNNAGGAGSRANPVTSPSRSRTKARVRVWPYSAKQLGKAVEHDWRARLRERGATHAQLAYGVTESKAVARALVPEKVGESLVRRALAVAREQIYGDDSAMSRDLVAVTAGLSAEGNAVAPIVFAADTVHSDVLAMFRRVHDSAQRSVPLGARRPFDPEEPSVKRAIDEVRGKKAVGGFHYVPKQAKQLYREHFLAKGNRAVFSDACHLHRPASGGGKRAGMLFVTLAVNANGQLFVLCVSYIVDVECLDSWCAHVRYLKQELGGDDVWNVDDSVTISDGQKGLRGAWKLLCPRRHLFLCTFHKRDNFITGYAHTANDVNKILEVFDRCVQALYVEDFDRAWAEMPESGKRIIDLIPRAELFPVFAPVWMRGYVTGAPAESFMKWLLPVRKSQGPVWMLLDLHDNLYRLFATHRAVAVRHALNPDPDRDLHGLPPRHVPYVRGAVQDARAMGGAECNLVADGEHAGCYRVLSTTDQSKERFVHLDNFLCCGLLRRKRLPCLHFCLVCNRVNEPVCSLLPEDMRSATWYAQVGLGVTQAPTGAVLSITKLDVITPPRRLEDAVQPLLLPSQQLQSLLAEYVAVPAMPARAGRPANADRAPSFWERGPRGGRARRAPHSRSEYDSVPIGRSTQTYVRPLTADGGFAARVREAANSTLEQVLSELPSHLYGIALQDVLCTRNVNVRVGGTVAAPQTFNQRLRAWSTFDARTAALLRCCACYDPQADDLGAAWPASAPPVDPRLTCQGCACFIHAPAQCEYVWHLGPMDSGLYMCTCCYFLLVAGAWKKLRAWRAEEEGAPAAAPPTGARPQEAAYARGPGAPRARAGGGDGACGGGGARASGAPGGSRTPDASAGAGDAPAKPARQPRKPRKKPHSARAYAAQAPPGPSVRFGAAPPASRGAPPRTSTGAGAGTDAAHARGGAVPPPGAVPTAPADDGDGAGPPPCAGTPGVAPPAPGAANVMAEAEAAYAALGDRHVAVRRVVTSAAGVGEASANRFMRARERAPAHTSLDNTLRTAWKTARSIPDKIIAQFAARARPGRSEAGPAGADEGSGLPGTAAHEPPSAAAQLMPELGLPLARWDASRARAREAPLLATSATGLPWWSPAGDGRGGFRAPTVAYVLKTLFGPTVREVDVPGDGDCFFHAILAHDSAALAAAPTRAARNALMQRMNVRAKRARSATVSYMASFFHPTGPNECGPTMWDGQPMDGELAERELAGVLAVRADELRKRGTGQDMELEGRWAGTNRTSLRYAARLYRGGADYDSAWEEFRRGGEWTPGSQTQGSASRALGVHVLAFTARGDRMDADKVNLFPRVSLWRAPKRARDAAADSTTRRRCFSEGSFDLTKKEDVHALRRLDLGTMGTDWVAVVYHPGHFHAVVDTGADAAPAARALSAGGEGRWPYVAACAERHCAKARARWRALVEDDETHNGASEYQPTLAPHMADRMLLSRVDEVGLTRYRGATRRFNTRVFSLHSPAGPEDPAEGEPMDYDSADDDRVLAQPALDSRLDGYEEHSATRLLARLSRERARRASAHAPAGADGGSGE